MSQSSANFEADSRARTARKEVLGISAPYFKKLLLGTTIGDDLNQAQTAAVIKALKKYRGGNDHVLDLNDDAQREYDLIEELATRLRKLNEKLEQEGLPQAVKNLLKRQSLDYEKEAKAFDGGLSPVARLLWAIGNGTQVAWAASIATLGQEKALIPTELPQAWRTIFIFAQYLTSGASSDGQLLDMTLQRSIMLLPNHIPYTLSFFLDVYGTPSYKWGSAAGALALVFLVIVMHEQRGLRDHLILDNYLKSLSSPDVEGLPALPSCLQVDIDEAREIQMIMDDVLREFELGNAGSNQQTRVKNAANMLFKSADAVIQGRPIEKIPNVQRKEKYIPVAMADLLIGLTLFASKDNPAVLVTNLRWASYYQYKLLSSAESPKHTVKDSEEIFCNMGAMMSFGLPLVSFPLMDDKDIFEDKQRLIIHTAAMMILQSTIVHLVAPTVRKTREWTGAWVTKVASTAAIEDNETPHERASTVASLDEFIELIVARLHEYERRTWPDQDEQVAEGENRDESMAGQAAYLVDVLSSFAPS